MEVTDMYYLRKQPKNKLIKKYKSKNERGVRKCDICPTHICTHNIPMRGRNIKIDPNDVFYCD
jgi:CRISPR/Cas system-associated protein Cas10 (large subunit of type III CRISPR-Cas system)